MNYLHEDIAELLKHIGVEHKNLDWSTQLALVIGIIIISFICTKLFRHLIIPAVHKLTTRTKATWDDYLFNRKMLVSLCRMIPPIVWYALLPFAFSNMPVLLVFLMKACQIYLVVTTLMLINSFLNSLYEISIEHETLRNRPLKGIYQMINLLAIGVGIILILSILLGEDATAILAGLGASAAVLMLIFKDSLLGLVAGVQLSANDMLRPGDWISMPKYGADGDVVEVSLTTVKVRNFDKTITTIPPYALVSDSFQNWRGMRETGGRRIKRSVNIDMTTIRFCSKDEIKLFIKNGWISQEEVTGDLVNFKIFRDYLLNYLKQHPHTHKELMIMVRQMQPTSEGIPMEIYCFSDTTVWFDYEQIQAEIFDHLIAMANVFGLRIFQRPTGADIQNLKHTDL